MLAATFNCNSVRSRLPILLPWLDANQPDLLFLQETKVVDAEFPVDAFSSAGWHVVFSGEKSYNGVAIVSRRAPDSVRNALGAILGSRGLHPVLATRDALLTPENGRKSE